MIALTRTRTAAAVHSNFRGTRREQLNVKLLQLKKAGKLDQNINASLDSGIWKESKKQLLIETHNKCAYCETPTRVVSYGDVEHFRPKSKYWWLAYCYENYLASCTACNQEYKKDFFAILNENAPMPGPVVTANLTDEQLKQMAPWITVDPVDDANGMHLTDFIELMNNEHSLIINPYYQDPSRYLAYLPILENKEVVVTPTMNAYKPVIKACEDLFGINRKELMDLRFTLYRNYMTFKYTLLSTKLEEPFKQEIRNRITEMTDASSPYAGMIRYFETCELSTLPWDFDIHFKATS